MNTGGPAFPINVDSEMTCLGMTLRDYFAAKAMQSLILIYEPISDENCTIFDTADSAYHYADVMLKVREQ